MGRVLLVLGMLLGGLPASGAEQINRPVASATNDDCRSLAASVTISGMPATQAFVADLNTLASRMKLLGDMVDFGFGTSLVTAPLAFAPPALRDYGDILSGNHFDPFTSHTLEKMGRYGLSLTLDLTPDAAHPVIRLAGDVSAALGSWIGRGSLVPTTAEVDLLTKGIAKSALTIAVLSKGPLGIVGTFADRAISPGVDIIWEKVVPWGRDVTLPVFNSMANIGVRNQMMRTYQDYFQSTLAKGAIPESFTTMYDSNLIEQVGFSLAREEKLNSLAAYGSGATYGSQIGIGLATGQPLNNLAPLPQNPLSLRGVCVGYREEVNAFMQSRRGRSAASPAKK